MKSDTTIGTDYSFVAALKNRALPDTPSLEHRQYLLPLSHRRQCHTALNMKWDDISCGGAKSRKGLPALEPYCLEHRRVKQDLKSAPSLPVPFPKPVFSEPPSHIHLKNRSLVYNVCNSAARMLHEMETNKFIFIIIIIINLLILSISPSSL